MAKTDLTAKRLREIINYDPITGILTSRGSGADIGRIQARGYVHVTVFGRSYLAHRIAWIFVNGVWPTNEIDHINGDRADNRLTNLREATTSENAQNRKTRADNTSGFTGVRPHQSAWRADIKINGKYKFVGSYSTPELAYAAYLVAKIKVHKFQPIPRRFVGA